MKAFLVWLSTWKGTELQVWWYDPNKVLRKNPYIIKHQEIPVEIASNLSIRELEKVYGI